VQVVTPYAAQSDEPETKQFLPLAVSDGWARAQSSLYVSHPLQLVIRDQKAPPHDWRLLHNMQTCVVLLRQDNLSDDEKDRVGAFAACFKQGLAVLSEMTDDGARMLRALDSCLEKCGPLKRLQNSGREYLHTFVALAIFLSRVPQTLGRLDLKWWVQGADTATKIDTVATILTALAQEETRDACFVYPTLVLFVRAYAVTDSEGREKVYAKLDEGGPAALTEADLSLRSAAQMQHVISHVMYGARLGLAVRLYLDADGKGACPPEVARDARRRK
jgi:hypothetical protein